jgi:hypothetical protein
LRYLALVIRIHERSYLGVHKVTLQVVTVCGLDSSQGSAKGGLDPWWRAMDEMEINIGACTIFSTRPNLERRDATLAHDNDWADYLLIFLKFGIDQLEN